MIVIKLQQGLRFLGGSGALSNIFPSMLQFHSQQELGHFRRPTRASISRKQNLMAEQQFKAMSRNPSHPIFDDTAAGEFQFSYEAPQYFGQGDFGASGMAKQAIASAARRSSNFNRCLRQMQEAAKKQAESIHRLVHGETKAPQMDEEEEPEFLPAPFSLDMNDQDATSLSMNDCMKDIKRLELELSEPSDCYIEQETGYYYSQQEITVSDFNSFF